MHDSGEVVTMAHNKWLIIPLCLLLAGCDLLLPGKGGEDQPCIGSNNLCEEGLNCVDSRCISPKNCTPSCNGKTCGSDGCGGSCGLCGAGQTCNAIGQCNTAGCTPNCSDKSCGSDGCGGQCGTCSGGKICNTSTGQCVSSCTPNCTGKVCGDDGCGGSCGTCGTNQQCNTSGQCECVGNWDPAANCQTCKGNWDPTQNCNVCRYHWVDNSNNCGNCPGNWDAAQYCNACISNWEPAQDCASCKTGWDPVQNCTTCLPQITGANCDSCVAGTFGTYPNCFLPPTGFCLTNQCSSIPPSGQTKCYNDTVEISCPTAGESFCGQDAQYLDNSRTYTCYNANGTVQNPCDSTADPDEVVVDSLTGLMWQRTTGEGKTWQAASDYCDGLAVASFSDWRLPKRFELQSLVDYDRCYPNPLIDITVFPSTQSNSFWSSSTYVYDTSNAWVVLFRYGAVLSDSKTNSMDARCVRGGPSPSGVGAGSRFIETGTGEQVVIDAVTGLMWQKTYDVMDKRWQAALAYCEGLIYGGYSDWRLPNVNELTSLVNDSKALPASDFPDMPSGGFWSSSTNVYENSYAYDVIFTYGRVSYDPKMGSWYARCVRLGM